MPYSEHLHQLPKALFDTDKMQNNFKPLKLQSNQAIWMVGSGSSYSQAIYLAEIIRKHLKLNVIVKNPYSFVRHSTPNEGDILIHLTQEAKRMDNYCPVNFAKSLGMFTILFTSKTSELSEQMDEVYYYTPEEGKLLVACTSYLVPHLLFLKWLNVQLVHQGKSPISIDINELVKIVKKNINKNWQFVKCSSTFLYAGLSQSVAVEGALKVNECVLIESESYELKHYSHGKHFVSYNQPKLFNVLYQTKDQDLVNLYQGTIFEPHHIVNYMKSDMKPELAIFDWGSQMLSYVNYAMKSNLVELEQIPIRESIRVPHQFKY